MLYTPDDEPRLPRRQQLLSRTAKRCEQSLDAVFCWMIAFGIATTLIVRCLLPWLTTELLTCEETPRPPHTRTENVPPVVPPASRVDVLPIPQPAPFVPTVCTTRDPSGTASILLLFLLLLLCTGATRTLVQMVSLAVTVVRWVVQSLHRGPST